LLSIVVPTHNEENRIRATLERLLDWLAANVEEYEVIVSDDGTDSTADIAREFAARNKAVRLLHFERRLGKGGGVHAGMAAAKGDVLIYDADGSAGPAEIPKLLGAKADVVIGSRKMRGASLPSKVPLARRVASAGFSLLVDALFGLGIRDTQCGFKLVKKDAARRLVPTLKRTGFEWDVELLLRARKEGMKIAEVPIEWHFRKGGTMHPWHMAGMFAGIVALKLEGL